MNNQKAASFLVSENNSGAGAFGRTRLVGVLACLASPALWWLNWHTVMTEGQFSIKMTILAPLCLFGGLLMALRPEWAGPWQPDAPAARKIATIAVLALVAAVSGADFYLLAHYRP